MIDGLDGFQLMPSRAAARNLRILAVALAAGASLVVVLFAVLAVATGEQIWWLAIVIYLALTVPADWVLWRVMKPPVLKADGTTITYISGFSTVTVPVSVLSSIHVGQAPRRPGHKSSVESYVFSAADGQMLLVIPTMWFRTDDMSAFAERLQVRLSERP